MTKSMKAWRNVEEKIKRLRKLVSKAYREGWKDRSGENSDGKLYQDWNNSIVKKTLDKEI